MAMSQGEKDEMEFKLGNAFKPAMPINREELFSGRRQQVGEIVDAINQNGQHVILYGERGVGKTSLANMIFFRVGCPGRHLVTPHVNCTSGSDYFNIWMSVLRDLAFRAGKQNVRLPSRVKRIISELEQGRRTEITPDLMQRIVCDLWDKFTITVAIIDEFDTVADVKTRQEMAETVKYFSDRNCPGTIVLIGVADDVETLITQHQSVERCLRQVRMPRMSRDEIEDLVANTLNKVHMSIEDDAQSEISRIAIGLPHYAHLLGLFSGKEAVQNGTRMVAQSHVSAAVRSATGMAHVTIHNAYNRATISTKKNALYKQVLLACALAETDPYGYFSPSDIRDHLQTILKRSYGVEAFARHLHAFSEPDRGPILKKVDMTNRPRFRFSNPLMQPFILMKGLEAGIINDEQLKATRRPVDGRLF